MAQAGKTLTLEKLCEVESLISRARLLLESTSYEVEREHLRLEFGVLKEKISGLKDPAERARLSEAAKTVEELMCEDPHG